MSTDNKNVIEDVQRTLTELRSKTDEGLKDVVRKEEVERIKSDVMEQITALQEAMAAANSVSAVDADADKVAREKADVGRFFTKADTDVAAITVANQGGYLLPTTFNDMVDGLNRKFSPLRGLAKVAKGEMNFVTPIKKTMGDAGVRGEFDALHASAAPKYDRLTHVFQEINTTEAGTVWASNNTSAVIDYTNSVIEDVLKSMAEQEGSFFMTGQVQQNLASGSPSTIKNGLLSQTKLVVGVDQYTNTLGSMAGIETKTDAASATAAGASCVTVDDIINLLFSLHTRYDANTNILTSREVVKSLLTQKDNNGRYLLDIAGVPGASTATSVLGKGLVVSDYFPTLAAAGDVPVAIAGDFKQGAIIVDAGDIRWIVDPLTDKRLVQYTGMRMVSSAPTNPNALRALYVKHGS